MPNYNPMFDDELPVGMTPIEGPSAPAEAPDDLPVGNEVQAPAVAARAASGSWDSRRDALVANEPILWTDVRKMTPDQVDNALVTRGLLTQQELDILKTLEPMLKPAIKIDEMKASVLAPSDSRGGDLYNLFQMANHKRTNAIAVQFSLGENLAKLTLPIQVEVYQKTDGTLGLDYIALENKRPSLYMVNGFGDKLFPPMPFRKDMTDDEKASLRDAREFEQRYFEMNGSMPHPVKVRTWNEADRKMNTQMCLVGRKGADYRLVSVPVDKVRERLEKRPVRKVYAGGTGYEIDLGKESPEVMHNILNAGGAWVKVKAEGVDKNLFVVYDVAAKNVRAGYSPQAVRQMMREEFNRKQDAKKASAAKTQKQEQKGPAQDASPRHTLR